MCELVERLLKPMLDKELGDAAIDGEDWNFVVHFYTYALVGLLLEWIEDGMKTEPEVLTRRLNTVLFRRNPAGDCAFDGAKG